MKIQIYFQIRILHSSSSINNDINSWTNFLSNLWITDNNISDMFDKIIGHLRYIGRK